MSNLDSDADLAQLNGANVGPVDVSTLREVLLGQSEFRPLAADRCSEGAARESGCLRHTSLLLS